ncbi:MAG: hypothetical protein V1809_15885 [Planctomycetota bacterium]
MENMTGNPVNALDHERRQLNDAFLRRGEAAPTAPAAPETLDAARDRVTAVFKDLFDSLGSWQGGMSSRVHDVADAAERAEHRLDEKTAALDAGLREARTSLEQEIQRATERLSGVEMTLQDQTETHTVRLRELEAADHEMREAADERHRKTVMDIESLKTLFPATDQIKAGLQDVRTFALGLETVIRENKEAFGREIAEKIAALRKELERLDTLEQAEMTLGTRLDAAETLGEDLGARIGAAGESLKRLAEETESRMTTQKEELTAAADVRHRETAALMDTRHDEAMSAIAALQPLVPATETLKENLAKVERFTEEFQHRIHELQQATAELQREFTEKNQELNQEMEGRHLEVSTKLESLPEMQEFIRTLQRDFFKLQKTNTHLQEEMAARARKAALEMETLKCNMKRRLVIASTVAGLLAAGAAAALRFLV